MITTEQLVAAQKANLETLFGLTGKAFESVEKLVDLNLQVAKASLSESANNAQAALSVKDAQELVALQANLLQPLAEKILSYSRHVYEIANGVSSEFSRAAEEQVSEANKKFLTLVDNAAKNAPAGSEALVALLKSAVSAASNALESVQKASKQAAEVAEANFTAMSNQVSSQVSKAASSVAASSAVKPAAARKSA